MRGYLITASAINAIYILVCVYICVYILTSTYEASTHQGLKDLTILV